MVLKMIVRVEKEIMKGRKNMGKRNDSRKGLAVAAVAGILSVGVIASLAYFTDSSILKNDFTTGSLDLEETETLWSNGEDGQNMYPGYTVKKNPTVQNVTAIQDNDAYVKAVIRFYDEDGQPITDKERCDLIYKTIRYDEQDAMKEGETYDLETAELFPNVNPDFLYAAEDSSAGEYVYYYKKTLDSAATAEDGDSALLFNTIIIPTQWSQSELDVMGNYQVEVEFAGIQSSSFTNLQEAMEALASEDVQAAYSRRD